jgi:hypothetical protein
VAVVRLDREAIAEEVDEDALDLILEQSEDGP